MKKLSPTQQSALEHMRDGAEIIRWPGGFWTTEKPHPRNVAAGYLNWGTPTWSVDIRTIRAMEEKGLLKRTYRYQNDEWRDPRILALNTPQ